MSWQVQLEKASFRGVPFEVQSADDNLSRRIQQVVYPYKDGADLDDLGRQARRTQLTAVFFGSDYEERLGAFQQTVDEGKPGMFIHPILGSWTARLNITNIHHSAEQGQDTALVSVEVIEDGSLAPLPELFTAESIQEEVQQQAEVLEAANTEKIAEVSAAVQAAKAFAASVQEFASEAADRVNQVRRTLDAAVEKARELGDIKSYPLVRACRRLTYSCQKLSLRVQQARPRLIEHLTATVMPLALLSQELYGDGAREQEIRRLNRIRNPFALPAGSRLRVYAR